MREARMIPWPLVRDPQPRQAPQAIGTPGDPDYLQLGRWWDELAPGHCCARGVDTDRQVSAESAQKRRRLA